MTKLVAMTFEEASKWIASQDKHIDAIAAELAAEREAGLQCFQDKVRLEAALREVTEQRDSWKRIAESGLGLTAETKGEVSGHNDPAQ